MTPDHRSGEHGPGVTWLAERAGCTPDELLADPRRLLAALADAERAVSGLGVRLQSDDDAVRADAEQEAERLRRMFVEAPDPAERFRSRVVQALRDATERVRDAAERAPDAGDSPSSGGAPGR